MFEPTDERPHGIPHNPIQPRDEHDQHAVIVGPGHGCVEGDCIHTRTVTTVAGGKIPTSGRLTCARRGAYD
jgi:hypothetical protein